MIKSHGILPFLFLTLLASGCDSGAIDPILPDEGVSAVDIEVEDVSLDVGVSEDLQNEDVLAIDASFDSGGTSDSDTGPVDVAVPVDVQEDVASDAAIDAGTPLCDPPLSVLPETAFGLSNQIVNFVPSGGTGAYSFELIDNQSGAFLSPLTGYYMAGALDGTSDTVLLTDGGCTGELSFQVHVVESMEARPSQVVLSPGAVFTFDILKGSGSFAFEMNSDGSGGTVGSDGYYEAGPSEGDDLVLIRDLETGESISVAVEVRLGTEIRPAPERLYVPMGESVVLGALGGSGFYNFEIESPAGTIQDGVFTPSAAVPGTVTITDSFLGLSTTMSVVVVESLTMDLQRSGFGSSDAELMGAGDLNGDGHPDMILGRYESSVGTVRSGAVFVYAGIEGGMNPDPVQIFTTSVRRARMGGALALGDMNGDGVRDLAIGSFYGDELHKGRVDIYHGQAEGFFEDSPALTLEGRTNWSEFGWTLELCDFNGDGFDDLAVGARYDEAKGVAESASNQGRIFIYNGSATGFASNASQVLNGTMLQDSGGWGGHANLNMPMDTAAGDLDNDGYCDLVASTAYNSDGGGYDGAVMVYKGQSLTDGMSLSAHPVLLIGNQGPNAWKDGYLGRNIAVGDLNNDSLLEIVIGEYYFSNCANLESCPGGPLTRNGRTWVLPGGALSSEAADEWTNLDEVGTYYLGSYSWSMEGWHADIADINGDGVNDLLTSGLAAYVEGWFGGGGSLRVYHGNESGMPDDVVDWEEGGFTQERVGNRSVVIGDLDGDGITEIGGFADRADDFGHWAGRLYLYYGDQTKDRVGLNLPGSASDGQFGRELSVIPDLNGDGLTELAVSSPFAGYNLYPDFQSWAEEVRAGSVHIYLGTPTGFESAPIQVLKGFRGHTAHDYLGTGLASSVDFDGDGHPDLAVVSQYDDRPIEFPAADYFGDTTCGANLTNNGSVYIFRGTGHAEEFTDSNGNGLYDEGEDYVDTNLSGSFDTPFELQPAFVYHAPYGGQAIFYVASGFDSNNDGLEDLVVGSNIWDIGGKNTGGVHLLYGRPYLGDGKTQVICTPDFEYHSDSAGDELGFVSKVGDLNGDDCDEFVVGARYDEKSGWTRGGVRILYGWNETSCAFDAPMVKRYEPVENSSAAGFGLSAGDIDQDGLPDLIVGGVGYRDESDIVGATWVLRGSYLEFFYEGIELLPAWEATSGGNPLAWPFGLPNDLENNMLMGETNGEEFGRSVAMFSAGSERGVAVGRPLSDIGGTARSGGVSLYRYVPGQGLASRPFAELMGETGHPGSYLGYSLATTTRPGGALVITGAYDGKGVGLDGGSVYSFLVPGPVD